MRAAFEGLLPASFMAGCFAAAWWFRGWWTVRHPWLEPWFRALGLAIAAGHILAGVIVAARLLLAVRRGGSE